MDRNSTITSELISDILSDRPMREYNSNYNSEPSIISYYNYSYDMVRSLNRGGIHRTFTLWKLYMRDKKQGLTHLARKNYQYFHVLSYLPTIREVELSSAGILAWARAGPYYESE